VQVGQAQTSKTEVGQSVQDIEVKTDIRKEGRRSDM